jgi:hypothetical protein
MARKLSGAVSRGTSQPAPTTNLLPASLWHERTASRTTSGVPFPQHFHWIHISQQELVGHFLTAFADGRKKVQVDDVATETSHAFE